MSQRKKKKPTNQDFVNVINNMLQDNNNLRGDLTALIGTFEFYIEMKGDVDNLTKYVDKKLGTKKDELQAVRQDNKESIKTNS